MEQRFEAIVFIAVSCFDIRSLLCLVSGQAFRVVSNDLLQLLLMPTQQFCILFLKLLLSSRPLLQLLFNLMTVLSFLRFPLLERRKQGHS